VEKACENGGLQLARVEYAARGSQRFHMWFEQWQVRPEPTRSGDPTVRHVVAWMRATYPQNRHAQQWADEIDHVFLGKPRGGEARADAPARSADLAVALTAIAKYDPNDTPQSLEDDLQTVIGIAREALENQTPDACSNGDVGIMGGEHTAHASRGAGPDRQRDTGDGGERPAAIPRRERAKDITVSATTDTVIIALLRRVGGRAAFTVNELARAEQAHLERRADGHKLSLWTVGDT
jgi:hypothetical protein